VVIESKKMIYASSGLAEALTLAASKFSRTLIPTKSFES
jgi:hypothetical protein